DSKSLLFTDKTGALSLYTVATGEKKRIDTHQTTDQYAVSWSHDGRWIAYEQQTDPRAPGTIWIYSVETGQKRQVTGGMFRDGNPAFDRKGEYLYYLSNRVYTRPIYDDIQQTW